MDIRLLSPEETPPYDLLLLADPLGKMIEYSNALVQNTLSLNELFTLLL